VHLLEGLDERLCLELRRHDVETAGEGDKPRSTVVGKVDENPVVCLALNHPPSPLVLDCVLVAREHSYKGVGRDVPPDIVLRDTVVDVFTIGLVVQLALVRIEDASRGIIVDHGDDARVWDAVAMDNLPGTRGKKEEGIRKRVSDDLRKTGGGGGDSENKGRERRENLICVADISLVPVVDVSRRSGNKQHPNIPALLDGRESGLDCSFHVWEVRKR
jgi:hypothetical protein